MNKYLLDTNILILYLAGNEDVCSYVEDTKSYSYISTVTVAELLSKASLTKSEQSLIRGLISKFNVLDFDINVAYVTAALKRKYKSLKTPDAILAATSHVHELLLISKDKAFSKVTEIKVKIP